MLEPQEAENTPESSDLPDRHQRQEGLEGKVYSRGMPRFAHLCTVASSVIDSCG